ncbi:type IV secretory system conjugative DNA transfer family protein [Haloarcula halophila]|uniref:type IV secretory system conjugative DNA transfer family protein n=1 Tax=Haloarcula TaxID=2237 RepID=UPI0023E35D18|nr:type IV secretion system DNA-binding domain-containing protein [Halomicroarcula sp. DFY41]
MSSDPTTQPGQKNTEVPTQLRDDGVVMFFWAFFMFVFPAMWVDADKPLHKRFWAWRYLYLGFTAVTAIFFLPALLNGQFLWLLLGPFAHIVAGLSIIGIFAGFQFPGISLPYVSYTISTGLYSAALVAVAGGDLLRRTSPASLSMDPYDSDEDELVVPLDGVDDKSDDAPTPPKIDQDVSTAVIGETGSGKTSAMQMLAYQFPYHRDTAVIAHDAGEDFQRFYEDLGFDVKRISAQNGDVVWNLFNDADSRRDFREIARTIFGEPDGHNPFHTPAKQVFEDVLMYLHLEAQKNNRREELCHLDLVQLLEEGHIELYQKLSEYDQRLDAGHLDPDQGKGARNVYQTLREHTRPVFVDDFAEYGEFSLNEYIRNPDGRVLIIDSEPSRMATLGPMFQLLLDWSIRYAMEAPNPTVHILDEIDQLPPLSQVTNLTARGRKEKARALVGVQTVGQLKDTYSTVSGILGNCPQGVYFGPGDRETTQFVLDEVGDHRTFETQEMVAVSRSTGDQSQSEQNRRRHQEKDQNPLTPGQLRKFGPGECVTVRRTDWWHGQANELHEVRDNLPERGVESPVSLDDTKDNLEDTDSWLALLRSRLGGSESDSESSSQNESGGDDAVDPDVWAADDVESPSLAFSYAKWDEALDRLDLDRPPISDPKHIDAFEDVCSMLDDRVLSLQIGADATIEIKELLMDLHDQTGLTPKEILNEVTAHTEALQMSDEFHTEFLEQVDVDDQQAPSDDASELFEDDNTEEIDDVTDSEGVQATAPDKVTNEPESPGSTETESDGADNSVANTNHQSPEGDTHTPDDEPVHDDEDIEKLLESEEEKDGSEGQSEDSDEFGASEFM